MSEFLFFQCLTSTSASASNHLCGANFSDSAFRSRNLWRFCLSFSVCTTFHSRFLFSPDTDPKTRGKLFRDPRPQPVSWSLSDLQQNRNPHPISWSQSLLSPVSTRWELCLLPCAGCCLKLLNVEEGQGPPKRRLSRHYPARSSPLTSMQNLGT